MNTHFSTMITAMAGLFLLSGCTTIQDTPAASAGTVSVAASATTQSSADQTATTDPMAAEGATEGDDDTGITRKGVTNAALSPLEDLNLRQEPIPDQLKFLSRPYYDAVNMSCSEITEAVLALDADLGRDWDDPTPEDEEDQSRLAWARGQSADVALGAVSSQARGFIPFRGLVREATGAESYAARVRRAYQIGSERRAFLKGIGLTKGCPPPASPWPASEDDEPIVYRNHSSSR